MADGGDSEGLTFRDAFGGGSDRDASDGEDFESESSESDTPMQRVAKAEPAAASASAARGAADAASGLVQAALASGQWQKVKDPSSGKFYFYNVTTRKTTWDLAKELMPPDEPPPVVADDSSNGSGLPQLQLGGSFGGSSAATGGFGGLPGADESLTAPPSRARPRGPEADEARRVSTKSAMSDEFEDDAVAKEKIVKRGGRVPVSSSYPTSGDLFNSVSGYKAFASESDRDSPAISKSAGSRQPSAAANFVAEEDTLAATRRPSESKVLTVSAPPAAVRKEEAAATATNPPSSETAAAPKPAEAKRRIFDSDSDFSTVSQTVAKMQEQQAKPTDDDHATGNATKREGSLPRKEPALTATATGPAARAHPAAATVPPRTAVTTDVTASRPMAAAEQVESGHATTHETRLLGPNDRSGYHMPMRSELEQQSEALESLVRAYAQLRTRHGTQADDQRVNRIAAAVRAALDEDHDDAAALPSTRGRVAHLLQRHQTARHTPNFMWGRVSTAAGSRGRGNANSIVANEQLDDTILDVVLGLFMEHSAGAPVDVATARRRHADPQDDDALLGVVPTTASGAPRPSSVRAPFSSAVLSVDFDGSEPVVDVVSRALDRYVVQAVRQAARSSARFGHGLGAACRVALLDVSNAFQSAACMYVGRSGAKATEPFAPGAVVIEHRLTRDEMFDGAVAKVFHCVPADRLQQNDGEDSGTHQYVPEYWVSPAHAWDIVAALTNTARLLDVILADGYAAFEAPVRADFECVAPALPEAPVVKLHLRSDRAANNQTSSGPAKSARATRETRPSSEFLQDAESADAVMFEVGRLADEVEAIVVAERKQRQQRTDETLAAARAAVALRSAVESAVAGTVSELLKDGEIRTAVKRRSTAHATEELSKDASTSMLDAAQARVNRIVEQLRYQVQHES